MIRAARLTEVPKRSPSRHSTTPTCSPQRTLSARSCGATAAARARCNRNVAPIASSGSSNAAYIPSPIILMTVPRQDSTASRNTWSWRARADRIRSASLSQRRVLPSMSVNRIAAMPVVLPGSIADAPIAQEAERRYRPLRRFPGQRRSTRLPESPILAGVGRPERMRTRRLFPRRGQALECHGRSFQRREGTSWTHCARL